MNTLANDLVYRDNRDNCYYPYPILPEPILPVLPTYPYKEEYIYTFNTIGKNNMQKSFEIAQILIKKKIISKLSVEDFIELVNEINKIIQD